MDDTYQIYVNRVARMTLPEAYKSQVQYIQASPKFQRHLGGKFQPVPFPGYSVITPPWGEESGNSAFYDQLQRFQQDALQQLSADLFIPLPPDSFHLTIADLIWDSAYRHADENPDFQKQLRDRIAQTLQKIQAPSSTKEPIVWQVLGLIVMPRALAVCLAPKNEYSYEKISQLRRGIYQNSSLIAVGIEQQYHLTAHITLGYFGNTPAETERDGLVQTLIDLNQVLLTEYSLPVFSVLRAELRKFDDMTQYYREADWAVLEF